MTGIRQRYIVFEILCEQDTHFSEKALIRAIWQKMNQVFGEIISFKAGLWMISWDIENNKGILRTDHLVDTEIIATLSLIRIVNKKPLIIHTRKTTGTIKKAKSYWKELFHLPIPENKS